MTGSLFETRTDAEIRREAVADNERRVHDVLMSRGLCPLGVPQRTILELLRWRQGRLQVMRISDLAARSGLEPRTIKKAVRELVVDFGLPIVSSRDSEDGGYFFATTAEERISGTADYVKEIIALAERIRAIRNLPDINTLFGQISIEMKHGGEEGWNG